MWFRILAILGVILAIDGLVLTFYPDRIERLLKRFMVDDSSTLLNSRTMRLIGLAEMLFGLTLMAGAYLISLR